MSAPVCFIVISLIIIDALLCQMLARAFAVMAWIKPPISLSSLPEIFCFVYVMAWWLALETNSVLTTQRRWLAPNWRSGVRQKCAVTKFQTGTRRTSVLFVPVVPPNADGVTCCRVRPRSHVTSFFLSPGAPVKRPTNCILRVHAFLFFHVLQLAAHQPPLHWSWLVIIKTKCVLWCCAIWNFPDVMYASSSSTSPDHHGPAAVATMRYLCSSCHCFLSSLMSRCNLIAPSHSERLGYVCYCLLTSAPVFCVSSSVVVWPFLSSCLYSVTVFVFSSPRLCLPHRSALPDLTHHTYRTHSVYISSPFRNWFLHITLDFFSSHIYNPFGLCLWTLFSCHHICVPVFVNHLPIDF